MWLWGSSSAAQDHGDENETKTDGNIHEFDDEEFDRLSNCSRGSEEFLVVGDIRKMKNSMSALEVDLKTTTMQLENSSKLHKREIEFKDRLIQQKEVQIQAIKKEAKQKEQEMQLSVRALQEKLDLANKQVEDKTKENRQLLDDAADLRRFKQEAEQTCGSLQSANDLLTTQLRSKLEELAALENSNTELKSKLAQQERHSRALEAAAAAQEHLLKEAKTTEVSQHQSNLIELASVKRKESDLMAENSSLKDELQRAKQDLAAKAGEVDRQAVRINELESQKSKFMSMRDELKSELARAQEVNATLIKQVEELQANARTQGQELAAVRQRETEQASEVKRLCDEVRSLQESLEGKALQVNAAKDEARCLKTQLIEATESVNDLKQELEQQTARMERMQRGVEEVTRQVDTSIITSAELTRIQNKYLQEVTRIMKENPNCIPIRCVRALNCESSYPTLEKKKFAAPKDMTLSRFNEHIRQKMKLSADAPLSVYVDSAVPLPSSELLEDIYNFCRGVDGFLHLKYSHVSEQMP